MACPGRRRLYHHDERESRKRPPDATDPPRRVGDALVLSVSDDGIGLLGQPRPDGIGLTSIRQRAADRTPGEREVLGLLANGVRNSEIAGRLGMTDKTVRNHVSAILMKLQVTDQTAAAIEARDAR